MLRKILLIFIFLNINTIYANSLGSLEASKFANYSPEASFEHAMAETFTVPEPADYVLTNDTSTQLIFGPDKIDIRNLQEGEPAYILEMQANKNRINHGENLTLDFYFSGVGNVDISKLHISIPRYIVKNNIMESYVLFYENKNSIYIGKSTYHINAKIIPHKQILNNTIIDLIPFNIYFKHISDILNEGEKPVKINGTWYPPVRIEFTIDENAQGGDYDIYTTLFYKDNNKWYATNQVMNVHINQWYENDQLQYFVYAVIFIQIISFIFIIIRKLIPWIHKFILI